MCVCNPLFEKYKMLHSQRGELIQIPCWEKLKDKYSRSYQLYPKNNYLKIASPVPSRPETVH